MELSLANATSSQIYPLLIGLVAPRPLAWITSVNLAGQLSATPFNTYNYIGIDPPIVAIGVDDRHSPGAIGKDTADNIRDTGEFVINVVNEAVAQALNVTAIDFPSKIDERRVVPLVTEPSQVVKAPRISSAPVSLECRAIATMEIGRSRIILGQVVAIQVRDEFVSRASPHIGAEEMHAAGRMDSFESCLKTNNGTFQIPRMTPLRS